MSLTRRLGRLLGQRNLGRFDYLLRPRLRQSWGGPFNGQEYRQRMFLELVKKARCQVLVETGTFLGTTTAFLASLELPIYTVEAHPRWHTYSSWRLSRFRRWVHLYEGDSREFLSLLGRDPAFPTGRVLFYLDAHGYSTKLPLREELQIIFERWSDSIVMVDDFKVPGTAYGYDDYGSGQVLSLEYLEPLRHLRLSPYFPAIGPDEETGKRRGCVVLCLEGGESDKLIRGIDALVPAPRPRGAAPEE